MVEMAVTEAVASVIATQSFALLSLLLTQKLDYAVSITAVNIKNNPKQKAFCLVSDYSCLVEMAVIETASENPFTQLSPGAVNLLKFPQRYAG